MDLKVASDLLVKLPLWSNIAYEVFADAVQEYCEAFRQEKKQEKAFEKRWERAFLTARWGRESDTPQPLCGWAWGRVRQTCPWSGD